MPAGNGGKSLKAQKRLTEGNIRYFECVRLQIVEYIHQDGT